MIPSILQKLLPASLFIILLLGTYKGFGYEQIKVLVFIVSISLIGLLWMGKEFNQGAILYSYLFLFFLIVKGIKTRLENWALENIAPVFSNYGE